MGGSWGYAWLWAADGGFWGGEERSLALMWLRKRNGGTSRDKWRWLLHSIGYVKNARAAACARDFELTRAVE